MEDAEKGDITSVGDQSEQEGTATGGNDLDMIEDEEDLDLDEGNEIRDDSPSKLSLSKKREQWNVRKKLYEFDIFESYEFAEQTEEESSSTQPNDNQQQPQASPGLATAGQWSKGDKVCSAKVDNLRKFICIDYPGVIVNKDKAVATLGGREGITQALSKNVRLELTYRPGDAFCKPSMSSESASNNLLIKVKRRRAVSTSSSTQVGPDGFEYKIEVVGVINRMVDFHTSCDHQFLPLVREKNGDYKEILSSIHPVFEDTKWSYLSRPTPLFIPPIIFTRKEIPANYHLEDDEQTHKLTEPFKKRKKRVFGSICVDFETKEVPSKPMDIAIQNLKDMCSVSLRQHGVAAFEKLFQERPLWTKTALYTRLTAAVIRQAKLLLPVVAFHFVKGPWYRCWCRFGYDPRQHPEAKIYQVVDWRLRSTVMRSQFEHKRGYDYRTPMSYRKFLTNDLTTLPEESLKPPVSASHGHGSPEKLKSFQTATGLGVNQDCGKTPVSTHQTSEKTYVVSGLVTDRNPSSSQNNDNDKGQEGLSESAPSTSSQSEQQGVSSSQSFSKSTESQNTALDTDSMSSTANTMNQSLPLMSEGKTHHDSLSSHKKGEVSVLPLSNQEHTEELSTKEAVESAETEEELITLKEPKEVDLTYMFFPDKIPPFKQMTYQICDIYEDQVQRKAHENDGRETVCTPRDGWCVPDFTALARDFLSEHVDRLLAQQT